MRVACGVLSYNRANALVRLVDSLQLLSPPPSPVVVFDDASDLFDPHGVGLPPSVEVVRHDVNRGVTLLRNLALRTLRHAADAIMLVEDDTVIRQRVDLSRLAQLLQTVPHLHAGEVLSTAPSHCRWRNYDGELCMIPSVCTAACVLLRTDVLPVAGMYDERYVGWGFGHVEYSFRMYCHRLIPAPFVVPAFLQEGVSAQSVPSAIPETLRLRQRGPNRERFRREVYAFEEWERDMRYGWWDAVLSKVHARRS